MLIKYEHLSFLFFFNKQCQTRSYSIAGCPSGVGDFNTHGENDGLNTTNKK